MEKNITEVIIYHGFDMGTTQHVIEKMKSDLSRLKYVWYKPGKEVPPWVQKQIPELEKGISWLKGFYANNWG